jgi:hypothetical protein
MHCAASEKSCAERSVERRRCWLSCIPAFGQESLGLHSTIDMVLTGAIPESFAKDYVELLVIPHLLEGRGTSAIHECPDPV